MVGGNVSAAVMRERRERNEKGVYRTVEAEHVMDVTGWLDYQSGQASHQAYQAKTEDTTHVLVSDYDEAYAALSTSGLWLEVGGRRYEVLLIDDPMGLHAHIEAYLRCVG